jgi:hypothetical protein
MTEGAWICPYSIVLLRTGLGKWTRRESRCTRELPDSRAPLYADSLEMARIIASPSRRAKNELSLAHFIDTRFLPR